MLEFFLFSSFFFFSNIIQKQKQPFYKYKTCEKIHRQELPMVVSQDSLMISFGLIFIKATICFQTDREPCSLEP